ncbi:MAG TPA: nuclear transport factor 2 family protein [Solirubrobacteraceae bacterium]|jgi:ketosteroid isomerase-like protein|nr:nuclear transport factor 2 family protein [Solirubrobacteraceae bacterium]
MPEEAMTPDLVERVRRGYAASSASDFDAMMSLYAPDAVWDVSPLGLGVYEGSAAIRDFFEEWVGTFGEFQMQPEEVLELGGGVTFAVVLQRGRPAGSDGHVQWRFAAVTVWVGCTAVRTTNYTDIAEGRAAAERLAESGR